MTPRRSLEESIALLRKNNEQWGPPLDADGRPLLEDHHAGIEREGDPTDITFFRMGYRGSDLVNLTLPRRFINRSDFRRVSFVNIDINQSFMCWNDFIECDFTDADLTCCDLRSSIFRDCSFVRCRLIGADLRRASFEGCDFTGADLTGSLVDDCTTDTLEVTPEQLGQVGVQDECGPQPKGG
jgi:hypothetical protein